MSEIRVKTAHNKNLPTCGSQAGVYRKNVTIRHRLRRSRITQTEIIQKQPYGNFG